MNAAFDRAQERAYQDGLAANDAASLPSNKLHAELRHSLLSVLDSSTARVPCIERAQRTFARIEAQQPVVMAVQDALNAAPAAEALRSVFANSKCPHVMALKFALAEAYVDGLFADGFDELRGVA